MTDDEILETIERRFAAVESRLPPTRLATVGEVATGSRPGPGSSLRAPAPLLALLAAVVLIATIAVVGRPTGNLGGVADAGSVAPVPASAVPSTVPSSSPSNGSTPILEVVRGAGDGSHVLRQALGWGPCGVASFRFTLRPDGIALDRAIDAAGIESGTVTVNETRYWIGPTAESAAVGFGSPVLALGRDGLDPWIVVGDAGHHLSKEVTPKGRTAWWLGNSEREVPCSDEPSASAGLELEIAEARPGVDAMTALVERFRLGPCLTLAESLSVYPSGEAFDRAIDKAGVTEGFVDVELSLSKPGRFARFWVGPTAESAARGYGSSVLATGQGNPWFYADGLGSELVAIPTPKGRIGWTIGSTMRATDCSPE
jgi:hypothetical protein